MKIIRINDINKKYITEDLAVCIGNFDGIHLGHQALINKVLNSSLKHGLITFDPHPIKALVDENYKTLMNINDKIEYLSEILDYLIIISFDLSFSQKTPFEFIKFLELNQIKEIVCGYDFHFGAKASGDVYLLKKYFNLSVVMPVKINDVIVKTQKIRSLIIDGFIEDANKLLGHTYSIKGIVNYGHQLGRTIGFPTANLHDGDNLLPAMGVYATKTVIDGKKYLSMTNIGHNPTFNHNDIITIETNIIDFEGDLYGKEIAIFFYKQIRPEKKFSSIDDLKKELKKNQDFVRKNLQK